MISKYYSIPEFYDLRAKYFEPVVLAESMTVAGYFSSSREFLSAVTSPTQHSPTIFTNPGFHIFDPRFLCQYIYPQYTFQLKPAMVVWNLYRYAVLNTTVEKHQVAFPIHDRKWVDSHDKGADRNVASYRASCRRERKKSPLAKEEVIRSPKNNHPTPVGFAQVYGVGLVGMGTSCSVTADYGGLGGSIWAPVGHHEVFSRNPSGKDEKDAVDAPKTSKTGSRSSTGVANSPNPNGPAAVGHRLLAQKNRSEGDGRDSQMAVKSFWDNAFKMSEGVSTS